MKDAPANFSASEYSHLLEGLGVPKAACCKAAEALVLIDEAKTPTEIKEARQKGELLLDRLARQNTIDYAHHKAVGQWMDDAASASATRYAKLGP